nr:MAG: coat protein [Avian associated calicivirus 1]
MSSSGVEKTPSTVANNTTGEAGGETSRMPAQSIENDPKTISATTERSPLAELLYANFVYNSTYNVTTQQKPGSILFALPVHPSSANQYNAHVAKMFNAWNGALLLRARFATSALYGGLIRIVHLPPNMNRDDINRISVKNLTAFPNIEVNPQNTEWSLIKGEDERNILFHYAKSGFSETDPQSFGGWIVAFVEASLIASADGATSVGLVVETCGRFLYNQPNPFFTADSNDPTAQDPLPNYLLRDVTSQGMCSVDLNPGDLQMVTWQNPNDPSFDRTTINMGTIYTGKSGEKQPYEYPGTVLSGCDVIRDAYLEQTELPPIFPNVVLPSDGAYHAAIRVPDQVFMADAFPSTGLFIYEHAVGEGEPDQAKYTVIKRNIKEGFIEYIYNSVNNEAVAQQAGLDFANAEAFETAAIENGYFGLKIQSVDPFIVYWFSASFSASAVMTATMARYMNQDEDFIPLSSTQSWVYTVNDTEQGVQIAYIRLCPNGIWTTNYPSEFMTFPGQRVYLDFNATVPLDEPLPSLTASMKYHRNFMRGHTIVGTKSSHGRVQINSRSLMRYRNDMSLHALAAERK